MLLLHNPRLIQEQILIGATVPTFEDGFNLLLRHSSIPLDQLNLSPHQAPLCCLLCPRHHPLDLIFMGDLGTVVVEILLRAYILTGLDILVIIATCYMVVLSALLM